MAVTRRHSIQIDPRASGRRFFACVVRCRLCVSETGDGYKAIAFLISLIRPGFGLHAECVVELIRDSKKCTSIELILAMSSMVLICSSEALSGSGHN